MNRLLLLSGAFALLVLSTSCNKEEIPQILPAQNNTLSYEGNKEKGLDLLLYSVDSLNLSYGVQKEEFRAWGFFKYLPGYVTEAVADKVGAVVGGWVGGKIGFAAAGAITVNPIVGVAGHIAGERAGAVVGSAAASYGMYLLLKDSRVINSQEPLIELHDMLISGDDPTLKENITYGDLHNILINQLSGKPDDYIKDGVVLVDKIYEDMANIANNIGFGDTSIDKLKPDMVAFCSLSIDTYMEKINEGDADVMYNYLSSLSNTAQEEYKIPASRMNKSMELSHKVCLASSKLNGLDLVQYEKKYFDLVNKAPLSLDEKIDLQTIGSISIGSTDYWKNLKQP